MISIEEARSYYSGVDAAHNFDHVLRVLKLAERICEAEGADMEILRAAVLLHDVARVAEDEGGPCHAREGAERARAILAGHPAEKVEAVAHAIATHRFRDSAIPQTLEARILYDADKLDAIGAIGVARAYAIAGRHAQRLWAEVPRDYARRSTDEARGDVADAQHTPVHEYFFKLSKLKDTLFTATARAIASSRHDFMVQFFERLEREVKGEL
nr:HD domain-containing protein [Chloroflexota bacterium]